ncbi:MAG: hypothetical protein KJ879_03570 [Nanoarchaeota archaeon]|nr:hypothetical protein [Nanoarchaeota archaeon]
MDDSLDAVQLARRPSNKSVLYLVATNQNVAESDLSNGKAGIFRINPDSPRGEKTDAVALQLHILRQSVPGGRRANAYEIGGSITVRTYSDGASTRDYAITPYFISRRDLVQGALNAEGRFEKELTPEHFY